MQKNRQCDPERNRCTYNRKIRFSSSYIKLCILSTSFLLILVLAGCSSIESNIKGTQTYVTAPDYPHIFNLANVEMDIEFEDYSTRVINPETGDPFFYMLDRENLYFLTGNAENLLLIHAKEGRIEFGFFPGEPRQAEHPNVDVIILPIPEIIEKTHSEKINLEMINASDRTQIGLYEIDLTAGGYGK